MDGDTINLRNVFDLLRRRFWVIVSVAVLCLAVAGGALLVLRPVYTATTLILVDPSKKNLLDPEAQLSGSSSDSFRVDSEVELVKSETTFLSVARELDLPNDTEFGLRLGIRDTLLAFFRIAEPQLPSGDEALAAVIDKLRDAVTVQRRGLTFLIAVSARSGRPDFATKIANAVSRSYIREQLEAKVSSTLNSRDIIQNRIVDASATVAASENAFDEFVDKNLTRISEATGRTDFLQIRNEIGTLLDTRAQRAALADSASTSLAREDWATLASSLKDDAVASLERQRSELLQRLADVTEGSQSSIDLRSSLENLNAQLKQEATRAVSSLRQSLVQSQARVTDLKAQLRTSIVQSDLPPDVVTSIYELQQNAEIARAQYQTLLTRQNELDTQAFLQVADSRIVSEATPPTSPSFPNPRLILILAGLAGIGLGVGLAFLIENFVGGFTSESQAEALLRVPVASIVPRQRAPKTSSGEAVSVADALIVSPLSVYSEAIRRIRIGVDQSISRGREGETGNEEKGGIALMVSSAAPGEGKTTIALSLARAYALAGMSTLIIDADLRKPSIHKQLGMTASEGLLEYLANADSELKSIMTVDDGSGAQIVLGSRRSDVATDQLVASKTFERLVKAARGNFDVVILDTPPVGPVVDGLYLTRLVDAIVFVVKWSDTPQQEARGAVRSILGAKPDKVPVLAVLNQQASNASAYRGKYAGYYADA